MLATAALLSIGGSAEARSTLRTPDESPWEPSSAENAAAYNVSDLLTEDVVPEGLYYIRNSEAGTFFAGANDWGTRLSLKSAGDKIELTRKTGSNGYIFRDVSIRGGNTGIQIGDPKNGDLQLWLDQSAPLMGYKFHKLTDAEVQAIDANESTEFSKGIGKDYYFIYYVDYNGNTVFLAKDVPGTSNHSMVSGKDINDEDAQVKNFVWELFTEEDLAQDLYDNATRDFYMSATPFLDNPDFSRNLNANGDPNTNGWTVVEGISNIWGEDRNYIAAVENKKMNIYQTLTTIPNGDYGVVAYAVYDGAPSASDVYVPTLYVQDASKKQSKMFKHFDQKYDMPTWSRNFVSTDETMLKQYRLDTIYASVWDNTLTIGFEGGGNGISAYFDNVQLLYFGMTKDVTILNQRYSGVSKQGKAILDANKPMGAEYKQALQAAVNNIPDFSDPKSIADAIVNITKAIAAANKSISLYGEIASKYDAEVSKLGEDAQNLYNEKVRKPIVEAGLLQNEDQLLVGLNAAKIFDRGKNADVTDLAIVNPSFEIGDLTGWTTNNLVDTGSKENSNGTYTMDGCEGRYLFNTWSSDGGNGGSPVYQTLKGLAPGTYTLTALMGTHADRWLHLNVGEGNGAVVASDSNGKGTGVNISVDFTVDNISEVVIYAWASFYQDATLSGSDQSWYKADKFHLIYNGPKDLTVLRDELTAELGNATALLKKKMNYDVEFALRTAQYNAEHVNQDDEEALTQAIANLKSNNKAAQTSVSVYDNINAIIEKGNKLDATGKAAFNDYVATIQTKWTNGQITDGTEELANVQNIYVKAIKEQTTQGALMTEAVSNWECTSGYVKNQFSWNDKASAIVNDWKIYDENDVEITYDGSHPISEYFHVNTWSTEAEDGVDGGSPMTIPFAEFWTGDGADYYLGRHHVKIVHSVEHGYKPGRYKIGIMARLATVDKNASAPTGYKFMANDMESKSIFKQSANGYFYAFDEVDFFVDDKGEIEFYFDIDHANFHWIAFKMLQLTYEGQTYSSEQAEEMIAKATNNYIDRLMNKDVLADLKNAINAFRDDPSMVNGQTFKIAEKAAENSVKLYEDIAIDIDTYVQAEADYNNGRHFDELGRTRFDELMTQILKAYADSTLTAADRNIVKNAYHEGLTTQSKGDFTELIENPGFETGDLTGWTTDSGTDVGVKPVHNLNGEDPKATYTTWVDGCDEGDAPLYDKLFNTWTSENGERGTMIKQTIKDIPNGKYLISAYVATFNDFYVFLFGNDVHSEPMNNPGYTNRDAAKQHAVKAEVEVQVTNHQLTIGAVGGVAADGSVPGNLFPDNYPKVKGGWYKVDAFTLEFLGAIDNKDLYEKLQEALEYADLYKNKPMNKDSLALLMNAYNSAKACDVDSPKDVLTLLNEQVKEYTNRTFSSIKIYEEINAFLEKAKQLDEAGYAKFQKEVGYIETAYNNGDITDGKAEMDALEDILRVATKAQVTEHTDWTGAIYNPSFENHGAHWGAQSGYKPLDNAKVTTMPWSRATGARYAYRVNDNDAPVQINYYQDIDSVQIGIYRLKATIYTNSKTVSIYGNELKTVITPNTSTDEAREVEQILVSWNGKRITFGIIGTLRKGEQIRVDNFQLEYISRDIDVDDEAVPADIKINQKVRDKQTSALEMFHDDQQPVYLAAAIDAIAEAKESAEYYKKARYYIDSCYNYIAKSNVYSKEAWDFAQQLLTDYDKRWDAGTLDNEQIKAMLYKIFQNGFVGFNREVAQDISAYTKFPVLYYIFDAWTLNREIASWEDVRADRNFHINTWSTEVTDESMSETTSQMTTPFIEYWTDNGALENATIHARAINLQPGWLYKMKVLTRVTDESGTNPADLKGISVRVSTDRVKENNGVPTYNTEPVDICKGEIRKDSHLGVVSQEFVVDSIIVRAKDNHDAHVYFDVENTNANWLAWKFCQFIPVRELKFYEEDDPASDEEIAKLWELIRRDEKKKIGFNVGEYSPYTNRDAIKTHNAARKYLESNYKEDGFNHCTKYQVNEYIKALYEDPDHPELSKWKIQNEDVNAVYNANFSLVHQSLYNELFGWKIYDTSVPQPKTGGMSASCATADPTWAKFDNLKGSVNLDGEENTFSTAAMFKFPDDKTSLRYCSPQSVYTYGDSAGFEMPLDPDQTYVFSCNFGYYTEGQNGSIRIEVRNAKTNELITGASRVYSPNVCISDTTQLPDMLRFTFHTPKASTKNYKNTLENFDNLETYKIVFRNANPTQVWTMVVSNIKLYRWPNAIMEIKPGAHYGTFIAPFDATLPEGVTAFLVTGKEDKSHEYKNPTTGETFYFTTLKTQQDWDKIVYQGKNGTLVTRKGSLEYKGGDRPIIPAHVPVVLFTSNPEGYHGIASGEDYDDRVASVRYYRPDETSDDVYLEGWEGEYDETTRQMKELTAENGWYVLSMKRPDMWACFYVVDENASAKAIRPDIPANRCYLVDPTYDKSNPGRIRKFIFELDEAIEMATSIENSDNQNQEIEIVGIYSANGVPQKTFKPGINILKMSDGTTRKKFIQ